MLSRPRRLVLFTGPSVPIEERGRWNVDFRPPIERGELERVSHELDPRRTAIAIADGYFGQSLAVTPTECRECLYLGFTLYGFSSIGALRAADCWPAGMVGIGYVYHMLRSMKVRDDSEVAVRYGACDGSETTYSGVRIRYMIRQAIALGAMDTLAGRRLLQRCLLVPWYERLPDAIQFQFEASGLSKRTWDLLSSDKFNPKIADAMIALNLLTAAPW